MWFLSFFFFQFCPTAWTFDLFILMSFPPFFFLFFGSEKIIHIFIVRKKHSSTVRRKEGVEISWLAVIEGIWIMSTQHDLIYTSLMSLNEQERITFRGKSDRVAYLTQQNDFFGFDKPMELDQCSKGTPNQNFKRISNLDTSILLLKNVTSYARQLYLLTWH